ncbi:basic salivary proline-rich protein 3 [Cinclus cinclus]|uniref:basic salivary proline-rich protein 3 n=1 Tax=Cinclus cinclus TaxID=127875 RepID=UPI002E10F32E
MGTLAPPIRPSPIGRGPQEGDVERKGGRRGGGEATAEEKCPYKQRAPPPFHLPRRPIGCRNNAPANCRAGPRRRHDEKPTHAANWPRPPPARPRPPLWGALLWNVYIAAAARASGSPRGTPPGPGANRFGGGRRGGGNLAAGTGPGAALPFVPDPFTSGMAAPHVPARPWGSDSRKMGEKLGKCVWGKQLLHTLKAQASSPEWRGNSPRGGLAPRCRSSRPHRPRREGDAGKGGVRERPLGVTPMHRDVQPFQTDSLLPLVLFQPSSACV